MATETRFIKQTEEIDLDRNSRIYKLGNLLGEEGWEESCNFPDCIWRWCKKMSDGRTICVSLDDAVRIERELQFSK